ncbi:hypothetical protein J32TS6_41620 [Virgibacillus pantothenticus]|uniref:imm11 family protein n=1 Tax=Virgibacillus TaxID=84406 RepID=UPI00067C1869|nr:MULTISPECIES: DUF1629 domain-containing protein [Virgibacillus]API92409.1 hypothetical protein BKP57_11590 [Virgibacillus sp. 6R]MBS7427345.1 hypothetical protein [Virgibacillus sp. 19R1-5]MBU8567001.1 hypothetical protein [Virgibacillus pantothenticus]MBU8601925.1 hypothetical protein [Virgibacillus pantothenticus]MBU8635028.1 hypothetical protein [Virgibacillus pantothenticus]
MTAWNFREQINILKYVDDDYTGEILNRPELTKLLDVVDVINYERSTYTIFELEDEKIYDITKFALNENKINGKHIFKLKDKGIPIFVSETFKKLVEENNITGCDFLEVEVV